MLTLCHVTYFKYHKFKCILQIFAHVQPQDKDHWLFASSAAVDGMNSHSDDGDSAPATPSSLDLEINHEHPDNEASTPPLLPSIIDLDSDETGIYVS